MFFGVVFCDRNSFVAVLFRLCFFTDRVVSDFATFCVKNIVFAVAFKLSLLVEDFMKVEAVFGP